MKLRNITWILLAVVWMAALGKAHAIQVFVSSDISASETWSKDNVYRLVGQVYVLPGATLTIEPGTVIASEPVSQGSLAVTRGAKIYANGTCDEPIIFTSTSDVATWTPDANHPTGGDPTTGTWREAVNEWGNLTVMGNGLISDSLEGGNTATPTGTNTSQMEGLVNGPSTDTYGGADDNDNSGSISYISLRYGGKVIGLANELNALSLGGIGRETDVHHIDIMNNVDDGIEIWGGTVSLHHVNIWNIGDDSFDIDQGWRGKAQFGLIVQGYGAIANQGSGVGDNAIEMDGAENSDAQPVTTSTIYNFTVVGQPAFGDHGTAWRDNARMQIRNSIFMELGSRLISFDNLDGDGSQGYGFNGTLSWANTWTTPFGTHSTVNPANPVPPAGSFNHPDTLYQVQTSGTLAELSDSVFYNNLPSGYSNANGSDSLGVTVAGGDAPAMNNFVTTFGADPAPIQSYSRGAGVAVPGPGTIFPITAINPLPNPAAAAHAMPSAATAPSGDSFFKPANYRGGFSPNENWLIGWTAADAFGFVTPPTPPGGPQAPVVISSNIAVSTTWTADNWYQLDGQIYVTSGATLTIEAGTVIASNPANEGSLAVTRGSRIYALGNCCNPIIFTSTNDTNTWAVDTNHPTGKDPKTGNWRVGVNEWGNLTIMGNGLISDSLEVGNTATPTGLNTSQMEGLIAGPATDTYGGNNDNDNSGTLNYVSLRYGGKVIGLANELNALSLGGIGRETDISHIDIMNNVDDGIEIWGGTVCLDHVNIWNIGDDSFDIDQGWRGKAQFGLIVQGYGAVASQGSGVGDNAIEMDGAENSDAQPVTTSTIYNFTVVGQPAFGDHGTAWRDNARMQIRNSIFMELGDRLISFDNLDGDGSQGYGFNGTLSWTQTWTTPFGTHSTVNPANPVPPVGAFNHPDTLYQVQTSGTLAEMTDCVFYSNASANAYANANGSDFLGVTVSGGDAPGMNNYVTVFGTDPSPIQSLTRGPAVAVPGPGVMLPVTSINPCLNTQADAHATPSAATAPADGFFQPAPYRGGFGPNHNWLLCWTAADAYGMITVDNTPPPNSTNGEVWSLYQ